MNTIGKILVILNFLFAIIVGALLVFDVAMRNQWKERYEALERQVTILKTAREHEAKMSQRIYNDWTSAKAEIEKLQQLIDDKETERKVLVEASNVEKKELEQKLAAADLRNKQTLQTSQRQADEIVLLNKTISERETLIVKLEADVRKYRQDAQNLEAIARARQTQNENLLDQNRELTKRIAQLESGINPDTIVVADPSRPNPPPVDIKGKVEIVEGELVQVSLGSDHGLAKNHTLDVYRTQPDVKYLGMVRIIDAKHQSSVGRLIQSGNAQFRPQLKVGDLVASKLTR